MVGIKSDKGNIRSINEDYADFYQSTEYKLYVVADGMGGHNAGEIASKTAVETLIGYFSSLENLENLDEKLEIGIAKANRAIYEIGKKCPECKGMGTTLTACLVKGNDIFIANVGDSCCFGSAKYRLVKITKDHSLVQELIDSGSITEEEGINHPKKNIITRALGTGDYVKIDIFKLSYSDYPKFLLCSDGLTNELSRREIKSIIDEEEDFDIICENLVSLAKERGGRDNITVLLFGGEE